MNAVRRMVLRSCLLCALALGHVAHSVHAEPAGEVATAVLTDLDDVRACAPLADGKVLSATGGGVVLFSADGKVRRVLTRLDGLPGTLALSLLIEPESGAVWIGTEQGVARLRQTPGEDRLIEY